MAPGVEVILKGLELLLGRWLLVVFDRSVHVIRCCTQDEKPGYFITNFRKA